MTQHVAPSAPGASPPAGRNAAALALALAQRAHPGHLDELRHGASHAGAMAPLWRTFFEHLGSEGLHDLNARQRRLEQLIRDNGVAYNV